MLSTQVWSPRMLVIYAEAIDTCRNDTTLQVFLDLLSHSAQRTSEARLHVQQLQGYGYDLRIGSGIVLGFDESIRHRCHPKTLLGLQGSWAEFQAANLVRSNWSAPALVDIVVFMSLAAKQRRRQNKPSGANLLKVLTDLQKLLLPFVATGCERYIRNVYAQSYDCAQPPNSQKRYTVGSKRPYVVVSHDAKWRLLEDSIEAHVGARAVLHLRKNDPGSLFL